VFGNHDDEGGMTRAELMALQRTLPYCLSVAGPADVSGVGNYVLPVCSAGGEKTAATLYFLDSNSYAETQIGGYGWLRRDQIAWYLQTAQALAAANGGEPLPALAFFHIPLSEYNEAWDLHVCYGHKFEPVCCPLINTGFYAALHEAGDVMGTFVGHDHVNDFVGDLYGIRLCYGRATGFNTYGRQGFTRGARLIQLREGVRDFRTWLRLEGGEVVTEQPQHEPLLQRRTCIL
ncbi:MAG: metallophosphoesterase family protein, partial [Chloroflexota bacterium]|nr:metallophosphoesterase family protein [Chloroflexota bacterium]